VGILGAILFGLLVGLILHALSPRCLHGE